MSLPKIELVLHPVRLRIMQTLTTELLTTQQISDRLPDVATSSIYRHLKILLDNEMVIVAETRQVKGIEEKFYQLVQAPRLGPEAMANLTAVDHSRYFTTYVLTLLHGFAAYVEAVEARGEKVDMVADRVGYTEVAVWATKDELDAVSTAINQALIPLLQNGAGNGRQHQKFAVITHPILTETDNGTN